MPELVPLHGEVTDDGPMTRAEARKLTDEAKAEVADLATRIRDLKRRDAWGALGFDSWKAYVDAEFGFSVTHADNLAAFASVREVVATTNVGATENLTEAVARRFAPVLRDRGPEGVAQAWEAVHRRHAAEVAKAEDPPAELPPVTASLARRYLVAEGFDPSAIRQYRPPSLALRLGDVGDAIAEASHKLERVERDAGGLALGERLSAKALAYAKQARSLADRLEAMTHA